MMITKDTYYIKRDDIYLWSGADFEMLPNDEIMEVRPMLFSEAEKVLFKDDIEVGQAIWLKDGDSQDDYTEQELILEEVEEDVDQEVIL